MKTEDFYKNSTILLLHYHIEKFIIAYFCAYMMEIFMN